MTTISDSALPALMQQLVTRGWEWLDASRQHFALPAEVPTAKLHTSWHLQPLGELALCGSLQIRDGSGGSPQAGIASMLLEFVWEQLRDGEVLIELQRHRPNDDLALECYIPFVRAGYRNEKLEALLHHRAELRTATAREALPNRTLGIIDSRRLLGRSEPDTAELINRTWLGASPEPWTADLFTLYSVTHTVFNVTDWGARPHRLPQHLQNYLHTWLPAWLDVYLDAQHWDMVSELLITDLCLSHPECFPHAWEQLCRAQQLDGLVPVEPGRPIEDGFRGFRNHYHATIVATIAGALQLASEAGRG